jgi:hypothetical protein
MPTVVDLEGFLQGLDLAAITALRVDLFHPGVGEVCFICLPPEDRTVHDFVAEVGIEIAARERLFDSLAKGN